MGGFGAAKFATKFPEAFSVCVIYDGAMLTWVQIQQRHAAQAAEIFNNSAATFDQYSPWFWLAQNAVALRVHVPFRDSQGALDKENRAWRDALTAQAVPQDYVETSCGHVLGCLTDSQGTNSWAFIANAFAATTNSLRVTIQSQTSDVRLDWPSIPGQNFSVEHRPTMTTNLPWSVLATNHAATATATNTAFVHTNGLLSPSGFYRVGRNW